jgi:hypothetical protein
VNNSVLRVDATTWVAMACVAVGWFGLHTLVATFGPIVQVVHFYDLPAVMNDPRWLLVGVSESHSVGAIVFGIVCILVIAAPALSRRRDTFAPRVMSCAPLLLMLLCGIALYVKTSSAQLESASSIGGYVARWANSATAWSGDVISRHIAFGAGAYLSFFASVVLAFKGFNSRRASDPGALEIGG